MTTYNLFYDSNKKIHWITDADCSTEMISDQQTNNGLSHMTVELDELIPCDNHYVNDAEDNIVEYSNFSLTVSATEIAIDNTATISNIPEGTEIIIQKGTEHLSTVTMDSTESLNLTGTMAGIYNLSFSKDRYYSTSIIITVGGQT